MGRNLEEARAVWSAVVHGMGVINENRIPEQW